MVRRHTRSNRAGGESSKCILSEDVSNLCGKRLLEFLAEHRAERFDQTFAEFQADIAGEAVAHNNIDFAFENISSFDISDEIDRRALEDF